MTEKAALALAIAAPSSEGMSKQTRTMLWILLIVYIFNFLDRQIVNILAEPIKAELGLSDTQLGLLAGPAFAVFYALLGIPIAPSADRDATTPCRLAAASLADRPVLSAGCGGAQAFVASVPGAGGLRGGGAGS